MMEARRARMIGKGFRRPWPGVPYSSFKLQAGDSKLILAM
jgi:hypothetical protein